MPTITLNLTDKAIDALCGEGGYQETIDGQSNSQSKTDFVAASIIAHTNNRAVNYLKNQASVAAMQDVPTSVVTGE